MPTSQSPGAVYEDLLSPTGAPSFSFAPHGDIDLGMTRSREDGSKVSADAHPKLCFSARGEPGVDQFGWYPPMRLSWLSLPCVDWGSRWRPLVGGSTSSSTEASSLHPTTSHQTPSFLLTSHHHKSFLLTPLRQMFLSDAHSRADAGTHAGDHSRVAPGMYDMVPPDVLSPKRKGARAVFGKGSRDAAATGPQTPAAIYDMPSTLSSQTNKFGHGPRTYSPEKVSSMAGPYLSK